MSTADNTFGTTAFESHAKNDTGKSDPRYSQAMAHLQSGAWEEAIAALETLADAYPDDQGVARSLDEARFRARLDGQTHVRARLLVVPWGRIALVLLTMAAIALAGYIGWHALQGQMAPALAEMRRQSAQERLLRDGQAMMAAGDLDAAEDQFRELLAKVPNDAHALEGLQAIVEERQRLSLYEEALTLQARGEYDAALAALTRLTMQAPDYRDVSQRIAAIRQHQALQATFAEAEANYEADHYAQALDAYQQVRAMDRYYRTDYIAERLYTLHLRLGQSLVATDTAGAEENAQALSHFSQALSLRPSSAEAAEGQRLAQLFAEGQTAYHAGYAHSAVASLGYLHDQQPTYLSEAVVAMLYDALVQSGDLYRASGDMARAYEQYRRAADLPIADATLAQDRLQSVALLLTPTPTPTHTPTPTATPQPTAIPTPRPLSYYRNQIVFRSDHEEQPGYYVMDASGRNRTYLGKGRNLDQEYEALLEQHRYSPDGRYRLFVQDDHHTPQVFIMLPPQERYGGLAWRQLTELTGLSYDPVWSPNGSRVAFVSQENGGDDIWVINPDGSGRRNLTRNTWEWEKHPSWSPDGTRIAFWSNREGHRQIYTVTTDGRDVRNLSQTTWDEYDPLWIR